MESTHQSSSKAQSRVQPSQQRGFLTESRSSSVLSQFPGKAIRRNSVEVRNCGKCLRTPESLGKEKGMLPDLYSALKQITQEKPRFTTYKLDTEIADFPTRKTPIRDKRFKPEKSKFSLQGIAVESTSLLRLPKAKYTLASPSRSSGVRFKQQFQLCSNSRMMKRSTVAVIDPAPAITLSLVEHKEEEAAGLPVGKTALLTPKYLLNPPALKMLRRHSGTLSATSLRSPSPLPSASSDHSSNDSLSSGNSSDASRSQEDTVSLSTLGVWSPWASHLSPFQTIIEIAGRKHTRIYQYLTKNRKMVRFQSDSKSLLGTTFRPKSAKREKCLFCACRNPLSSRNLRNFQVQGLLSLQENSQKVRKLQRIIAAKPEEVRQRVLLIQVDGVIADVRKSNPFDLSAIQYVLRAGVIEGLNSLSRSFSIVLFSALAPPRFQKLLNCFLQHKVPILAAYGIESSEESLENALSMSFLDYNSVYFDLKIKQNEASARILVLSALLSETISGQITSEKDVFYLESGLKTRLNALYLPVVLPSQPFPAVSLLVSHLRLENPQSALKFTSISREIELISQKARKWSDAFDLLQTAKVPHLAYIRTYKVLEAYYAYLLPSVPSGEMPRNGCISQEIGVCRAHPCALQVLKEIPESRLIVLAAPQPSCLFPCQIIDFEPFRLTSKAVTLLEYSTSEEIR